MGMLVLGTYQHFAFILEMDLNYTGGRNAGHNYTNN